MVSSLLKSTNPSIGVYAKADGIHLRITAKAPTRGQAESMIAPMEEAIERILGGVIWGRDEDTFEIAVTPRAEKEAKTLPNLPVVITSAGRPLGSQNVELKIAPAPAPAAATAPKK